MSRTHGSFGSYARTLRALIITALLLACGDSSSNSTGTGGGGGGGVAQLSITPSAPTITVGAQLALQAQVRDANGNVISGASVFWSSADTTIVTISSAGIVTGKALGSAQIAASSGGQSARAVVTVSAVPVAAVSVLPAAATLIVGGTTVLKAVTYDASQTELTGRTIAWASSSTQVASVDATGNVIGVAAGTATITATSEGKTASSAITVTVIPIAAISIAPSSAALTVGQSASLTAIATDANANVLGGRPITWKSADSTVATVSTLGLVTAVAPGNTTISATAEGKTGVAQVVVTSATPTPVGSVVISPATASVVIGGTTTLSVTLRDAGGTLLSGRTVTWTSSVPAVATVSSSGDVTAVAVGTTTITATSEGKAGTATVTVSNVPVASIAVTPTSASLLVGGTATLTAVTKDAGGNVLTGRTVTWTSSAPSIASVSSSGVVTGVAAGNATITATSEAQSVGTPVSVALAPVATITLSPTSASLVVGGAVTIAAVLKDANSTVLDGRTIAWSSNTPGVATVDQNGVVAAVTAGTATITATSEGKSATATITVSLVPVAFVIPAPTSASLYVGATQAMSAITQDANHNALPGRVVTWSTSASSIATVDPATGLVTAVAPGNATITATSEGKTGSASIVVTLAPVNTVTLSPTSAALYIDSTAAFTATLKDASNNTLTGRVVTWSSSNTAVATVSASGIVTAQAVGTTNITATSEGKTSPSAAVTVSLAPVATVTLSPTSASLYVDSLQTFTATLKDAGNNTLTGRVISWGSTAPSVASVSSSGVVKGLTPGTTNITATSEGVTSTAATVTVSNVPVNSVSLTPTSATLYVDSTATFTATPKDINNNTLTGRVVTWNSSVPTVASVNSSGVVTALTVGTTSITATSEGKTSAAAAVTVSNVPVNSVTVNPTSASLYVDSTATFTATPKDVNNNTLSGRTITWNSSVPSVATVSSSGVVTAVSVGTTDITATSEGVTSSAVSVTVSNVPVASVDVTPANPSLSAGTSETVTLTATPKDGGGNTLSLSGRTLSWSSDTPSVATVDPSSGLVTAIGQGSAIITATVDGVPGSTTVTVNP